MQILKHLSALFIINFLLINTAYSTEFQLFSPAPQLKTLSTQDSTIGTNITTSDELKEAVIGDVLTGLEGYRIVINKRSEHSNGDVTLFGNIENSNYRAIITRGTNGTFARIHTENGVYNIEITANGEKLLTPEDNSNFISLPADDGGIIPPETLKNTQKKSKPNSIKQLSTNTSQSDTNTTTIDIMVFWDGDFQTYRGGASGALTSLNQIIAEANSDFSASGIYIQLNLVYSALKGSFSGGYLPNEDILEALKDNNSSYGFGDVNALRAQYKADLVGYLRHTNSFVSPETCGVAYQLGSNGKMSNAYRDGAFFVVSQGKDLASKVECSDYVFSHEIGHNLGSAHDRKNHTSPDPIFPYSYGYGEYETGSDFGTIMSYSLNTTYLFSNPNIDCDLLSYTKGTPPNIPCGQAGYADNAKGFNAVRNDVAGFDTKQPTQSNGSDDGGGCFIATAAYGSYFSPKVKILRQFRDEKMSTNLFGSFLITQYYQYSPPIANYIKDKEWLRFLTRVVLTPIVYFIENTYIFYITLILTIVFIFRKKWKINGYKH